MALSKITTASLADDSVTGAKIENNPTIAGNLTVSGGFIPSDPVTNKNIIINGNFSVDQRKEGGVHSGNGDYNLDRWLTEDSGNIDNLLMNITQDGDTPSEVGEGTCLKYQCKTVESAVAADEFYSLNQYVEARNLQYLGFGTAEAKSFTVSFWVKSSLTGVFGFSIYQDDGGDIVNGTYTISSAGTWEKKTFTFAGNTADTIANDSTRGWKVQWGLWVGSNYNTTASSTWSTYSAGKRFGGHVQNGLATTDESTWQLAFVQVEAGSIATPFEHENYSDNLRRCQRYYRRQDATAVYTRYGFGRSYVTTAAEIYDNHPVQMRAIPTLQQTGTAANYAVWHQDAVIACSAVPTISSSYSTPNLGVIYFTVSSGLTVGQGITAISNNNTDSYIGYSAEL